MKTKQERLNQLNAELINCTNCDLAQTRKNVLCGEGKLNSTLFLVALSPGENEDLQNKMFIGPSGKILDQLLSNAHINRKNIYISNLIKCNLPQNRKPKMREIAACHHYLDKEITIINPEFIVPLGFYASRYILQKYNADIPSAKADFHPLYGKLFYASDQKIYPLPHPASLLYNPDFTAKTQEKYHTLSILGQECKWHFCCPMKTLYNQNKIPRKWIELYCHGNWKACIRFQMEENGQYHSDYMLPDGSFLRN